MKAAKRLRLAFNKSIPNMQQQAREFEKLLKADLAAFTTEFPFINAAYVAKFAALIKTAETIPSTEVIKEALKALTAEARQLLAESKTKTQELYKYVEMAFPEDAAKLELYGKKNYVPWSRTRPKMVKLMEQAHAQANGDDKTELAAKGWSAIKQAAYNTLKNALKKADKAQGAAQKNIKAKTEDYYTAQNNLWKMMSEINTAAQIVHAKSYGKRLAYSLYPEAESRGGMKVMLELPAGTKPVVLEFIEPLAPEQPIRIKMMEGKGSAYLCFSHTAEGASAGTEWQLEPGGDAELTYEDFGGAGLYLRARQDGKVPMLLKVKMAGM